MNFRVDSLGEWEILVNFLEVFGKIIKVTHFAQVIFVKGPAGKFIHAR